MPTKTSRSDESKMFEAIGSGIQAFSLVEFALGTLFTSLMRPTHGGMSALVLEEARHIETKLRIVGGVGKARLKGDDLTEFNNLVNRIGRKADTRHKLAHWAVGEYPIPISRGRCERGRQRCRRRRRWRVGGCRRLWRCRCRRRAQRRCRGWRVVVVIAARSEQQQSNERN